MSDKKQEQKWQTEDDERTMARAAEIQASPDRMKRVLALMEKEAENQGRVRLNLKQILKRKN
ncbi:MAG: hypothetical protein GY934_02550 [Gammaproteobacteria bacterium]|nr:hypothetical protein [Gammaproteobacteria bacterium]